MKKSRQKILTMVLAAGVSTSLVSQNYVVSNAQISDKGKNSQEENSENLKDYNDKTSKKIIENDSEEINNNTKEINEDMEKENASLIYSENSENNLNSNNSKNSEFYEYNLKGTDNDNNVKEKDLISNVNTTTGSAINVVNVVDEVKEEEANINENDIVTFSYENDVDIAQGKTATASSGNPSLAVDGDTNTRWESEVGKDPQWLCVDLGGNFSVEGVKIKWEFASAKEYKIQISKDGNSWKDIAEVTDGANGEEREIDCNKNITGKYIRMYGTKRTSDYGYSIFDFKVYGQELGFKSISGKNKAIKLNWYEVKDADGYNIYRSKKEDGNFEKVNTQLITKTSYTDTTDLGKGKYYYKIKSVNGGTESEFLDSTAITLTEELDFGDKVKVFDPSMSQKEIQGTLDNIFSEMESNQFGDERYAVLFKPGEYNADVNVGFYTSVSGLGKTPDDVNITGAVRCEADWFTEQPGNATQNFWRTVENLAVIPEHKSNNVTNEKGDLTWAVSQAAPMRRVHVKGNLSLWDPWENDYDLGWASGGFIADTKVDGTITSASQQQFFTRTTDMKSWSGSNWNMVFVGDNGTPEEDNEGYLQQKNSYTVVDKTSTLREKPFLYVDDDGSYKVFVPDVTNKAKGVSWEDGIGKGKSVSVSEHFYIANPDKDTADSLNKALSEGKNILFTPGIYRVDKALHVTKADTIIFGLGLATLNPTNGNAAILIDDVDGVSVSGLLFNAAEGESPYLLKVGQDGSHKDHSKNPTGLYDLFFRVGGDKKGGARAKSCIVINSDDVVGDDFWVWRADHGDGVGWELNRCDNGLVVNGDDVTIYGLFVEHFNEYQTLWNGERGKVYFYQTELPYDVPNQEAWKSHDGTVNGWASYKVSDNVKNHELYGAGVYTYFTDAEVLEHSGIEVPDAPNVKVKHACTVHLNAYGGATHIVNNSGNAVNDQNMRSVIDYYCNKVGDPVITPPANSVFSSNQKVSINCPVKGAEIRYTIDGSDPTETSGMVYTKPFTIDETTTVKAIAYKKGMATSGIAEAKINIKKGLADDLALGRPSKSSSGNPALAFDGDTNSRWESNWSKDEYISVDLGSIYDISEMSILWEKAYAKKFKIQVSNDGVNWIDAYNKTNPNFINKTESVVDVFTKTENGGSENIVLIKPITGRYVKLQGVEPVTDYGYSIFEFEIHGEKHAIDKTTLKDLYEQHKEYVKGNYTDETWNQFINALNTAKNVINKDSASQEEIVNAYNNLINAIQGLKEKNQSGSQGDSGNKGDDSKGGSSSGGSGSSSSRSSSSSKHSSSSDDDDDDVKVVDSNTDTENTTTTQSENTINDQIKKSGWNKSENSDEWYYIDAVSGQRRTGWLNDTNGIWYYLDVNSGLMKTNWLNNNNEWYYLNPISDGTRGAMKTGWFCDSNGRWYYLNPVSDGTRGAMKTGWFCDSNGKWYYFDPISGIMQTGWLNDNGVWYYLDSDGSMVCDTYIDGYYIGSDGRLA